MFVAHKIVSQVDSFFFQAEEGIGYYKVTGVQTCALPICQILATNHRKHVGGQTLYLRRYPQGGLYSAVVGYSTQSRSRAGLEESENDYLTGSNTSLKTRSEERRVGKEGRSRWSPYH